MSKLLESNYKLSLLQYPAMFEQALFKLSWAKPPQKVLEEYGHKAQLGKAPVTVLADAEERAWAVWGNLQRAHSLD